MEVIFRPVLIGLIAADSKFIDERDAITEYVRGLKAGEGLDEAAIRAAGREGAQTISRDDLRTGYLKVAIGSGRRRSMAPRERSII